MAKTLVAYKRWGLAYRAIPAWTSEATATTRNILHRYKRLNLLIVQGMKCPLIQLNLLYSMPRILIQLTSVFAPDRLHGLTISRNIPSQKDRMRFRMFIPIVSKTMNTHQKATGPSSWCFFSIHALSCCVFTFTLLNNLIRSLTN